MSKYLIKISKIFLAFLTFFLLYFPIFIVAILSVNESQTAHSFSTFSLKWYQEIITNVSLRTAIINTFTVAIISTLISTTIGTAIAIGINASSKKEASRVLFLSNIPIVNPDIVTGLSLMIVFSFIKLNFGFQTMLLSHIFFSIPFVILSVLPKLRSLDKDLYYSALDLGCTPFQAVLRVIIPAIKVGIVTGALIAFTMSIDDFVISYFTTGNGFSNFSIWLYSRLGRRSFSPAAYAYNTLIIIATFATIMAINIKSYRKEKIR
jgi:spermidine/putrescine transport system permease protein